MARRGIALISAEPAAAAREARMADAGLTCVGAIAGASVSTARCG